MEEFIVKLLKCKKVKLNPSWRMKKGFRKPNKRQLYLDYLIHKDIRIYKYRIKHTNPELFILPF
jgi:hypothetical protein